MSQKPLLWLFWNAWRCLKPAAAAVAIPAPLKSTRRTAQISSTQGSRSADRSRVLDARGRHLPTPTTYTSQVNSRQRQMSHMLRTVASCLLDGRPSPPCVIWFVRSPIMCLTVIYSFFQTSSWNERGLLIRNLMIWALVTSPSLQSRWNKLHERGSAEGIFSYYFWNSDALHRKITRLRYIQTCYSGCISFLLRLGMILLFQHYASCFCFS